MTLEYYDVRELVGSGDVFAFGGEGLFSNAIKIGTLSPVSHVGIVAQHDVVDGMHTNTLVESTSLDGAGGVSASRLSTVIENYNGRVWWLRLREETTGLQNRRLQEYLRAQIGKEYDMDQVFKSALDAGDSLHGPLYNIEDDEKFFCSELDVFALKHIGVLPDYINASETTPADLVRMAIYSSCVQIKGEEKEINGFNSLSV